jgi:hypothetical protein
MINANELRIGNLVYTWDTDYDFGPGNQFEEIVKEIRERVVEFKTSHAAYYEIEPILLTPEWLERCGFERYENGDGNGFKCWEHNCFGLNVFLNASGEACAHWCGIACYNHPQHVHQLQNLYFALTGEEVIINEPA